MRRILVYSPYSIGNPHLESLVEQILLAKKDGSEVRLVTCPGALRGCGTIACNSALICRVCQNRAYQARDLLQKNSVGVELDELCFRDKVRIDAQGIDHVEALKKVQWQGHPVGMVAASTIISKYRDSNLELNSFLQSEAGDAMSSAAELYLWSKKYLESEKFDEIILFNGRLTLTRPLCWAAQELGIPFSTLEQGANLNKYIKITNGFPHDLDLRQKEMLETWASSALGEAQKKEIAEQWFIDRRNRVVQSYIVYTDSQEKDRLPVGFRNPEQRRISIFLASEDELAAIDVWKNPYFENQVQGVMWALRETKADREAGRTVVCIRVHPNLAGLNNDQVRSIAKLRGEKGVILLEALDPADTYGVVDASDLVFVFVTTVGIESVYWGKPVLLLGRCFYDCLPGLTRPKDLLEASQVLVGTRAPEPVEVAKDAAMKYGFWQATMGQPYVYYKPESLSTGVILGKNLVPKGIYSLIFVAGRFFFLLRMMLFRKLSFSGLKTQFRKYLKLRQRLTQVNN